METQTLAYFLFGTALVVLFGIIIIHYYSKKRHDKVEEAKYKMLDDDE
jgi:cbb3-type cytochrome oxidase subunit 3